MKTFEILHASSLLGKLTTFDRIIFKGHLTGLMPQGAFARFLTVNRVLLKDFRWFVQRATKALKDHAQGMAQAAGRPFLYLQGASTKASGSSKEDQARRIAERDGITEGLIAVFSVLEPCWSFAVVPNRQTHRLEVVRRRRKCLHFYFYLYDSEFGFMHVRLQSWFPFTIQIYINGREWLARQLDARRIPYKRHRNAFLHIADLPQAQIRCRRLATRKWPRLLNGFARRVNPWLSRFVKQGFGGYYWVTDQAEIATDVMFRDRASLEALLPDLFHQSMTAFSAEDVLRYLGRKPHGNFLGEVGSDRKKRPQGTRVKFRMKRNSLKMYDKASVLRIETTINNPREFRVLRHVPNGKGSSRRWMPMRKGVADFWRYAQVGEGANNRYLEALGQLHPRGKVLEHIDNLCRTKTRDGQRFAKLQPLSKTNCQIFKAILSGRHSINGFRNGDIAHILYPAPQHTHRERRRNCERVSRLIRQLRGHGLVAKVPRTRLYRVTPKGYRLMAASLTIRQVEFPQAYQGHAA